MTAESQFAVGRDGTRLFVRRREGPPSVRATAVLSDGIACDGFIWKYLWDDLGALMPVVHWHYRGHGRSGRPEDPRAIEFDEHVHDLDAVRRAVDDPPVVLFGHSMGCQVALETFRLRRDKVKAMVLICGAAGRITHTFKDTNVLAQYLPKMIERVESHPDLARALWSRVPLELSLRVALASGEVDASAIKAEDFLPYLKHMVDIDLAMFLKMLRSAGEHDATDLLPEIDVPVLVFAGDRDSFTPPRYAEALASALPKGELEMVAGGTHVVPIERKDLVAERIQRFLRERVGL